MKKSLDEPLELSVEDSALLQCIKSDPKITQNDLAKQIGRSIATAKRRKEKLKQQGIIQRQKGKRYGQWEILIDKIPEIL